MIQLSRYNEKVQDILKEVEIWRKTWRHKNPVCQEWILHETISGRGYCSHYAKAIGEKFKDEITELWNIHNWDGNVYKWVYISD